MDAVGSFLLWSLLLPTLPLALYLPTLESSAWDSPLHSAPVLSLLEVSSQEPLLRAPPATPHSDSSAHELSSGDGEQEDENRRIPIELVDLPGKGASASSSGGSLAPLLTVERLALPAEGFSDVSVEAKDTGNITLEPSTKQGKNEFSIPFPSMSMISTATPMMATFPTSARVQDSALHVSQEKTRPSFHQAEFRDGLPATTLSPRPTESTIPLVTLPANRSHVKWEATQGTDPKGGNLKGWLGSREPEQELLGQNQTTVKYWGSSKSSQVSSGLPASPLRPTQAAGYTQNLLGSRRDTPPMRSTSQEGIGDPIPFTPSLSGSTPQGPRTHQRSTHWNLVVDATQQPGPWDMAGMGRTHFHSHSAPSGTEETHKIAKPQRVRGAVDLKVPPIYSGSSTPGQNPSMMKDGPGTKRPDASGRHPSGQSTTEMTTTPTRLPATPRRGVIQVTTHRVLQRPQPARLDPSLLAMQPASTPPCPRLGSTCSQLLPNQSLLRWEELEHTLSFAWGLHVYGFGVLFLLLSLLSLACVVGSFSLPRPHLPYVLGASALLLTFGGLRATFFLIDPYGSRRQLPARAVRLLYTAPFPLLLSTLALLLLHLLQQAHLHLLPRRWQILPLWAGLGSLQSLVLLGADLSSPPVPSAVPVGLHTLSCTAGLCLLPATIFAYWLLRHSRGTEGTVEPVVWRQAWVLLASSGLAMPCCGLQFYGVLWLSGVLGQPDVFSWGWWFVQFWFRIGESVLSFALLFLAWQALCQHHGSAEHSCWAKLTGYFYAFHKAEGPEYPNNCYDWTGGVQEKVPNPEISNNLIRNPSGNGRLWALRNGSEWRAGVGQGSSPSPGGPIYSPKCPNVAAAAAAMGRSFTSICFERDSALSLAELEFRPPSPINLSRSIDDALFREHLVHDSIFLCSSLNFPSRLTHQDSYASLRGDGSSLTHPAQPLLAEPRRSSDPDCLYTLTRATSLGELATHSRGLAGEPATDTSLDSFSRTSFSRASLKISWNPWHHGLSSPESLPAEELPSQAQLLVPEEEQCPAPSSSAPNSEHEARKSFLALSKQVDSRSLSSDTIEL